VDGDVIRISTDYKKETEDKSPEGTKPSMRWHRVERVQEYSTRALRMPEAADLSKLEASMDAGVLTVKVPKHEARASKARRIDIK
jgi:HSP20 family molecular chaperone IbpA